MTDMLTLPARISERVEQLLSAVTVNGRSADDIRYDVVMAALRFGLGWRDIVLAMDELELRTGRLLHATGTR